MYEKRKSVVQASLDFLFYARRTSNSHHKRYSYSLLGPGTLTAHRRFHLVLLHSCPDTVQRFPLRKTKTSTPLTRGSFTVKHPGQNITPALAACRYRAPLTPRLCGLVKYTWKPWFCQVFPPFSHDIRMNCFPSSFSKYLVFKNLIPVPKTPLGSY